MGGLAATVRATFGNVRGYLETSRRSIGRAARAVLLALLSVGLTTCGGGLNISQFTHATKIVVVNTFGQVVAVSTAATNDPTGASYNPNPSVDPTGNGHLVAYYMTLRFENVLGQPATLVAPQNDKGSPKLYWRSALEGLKDCVVFKPRLSTKSVDPSRYDYSLPKAAKLKAAMCNVDLDEALVQVDTGPDALVKPVDANFKALPNSFATPKGGYLQLALFEEKKTGGLNFVNPEPYLHSLDQYAGQATIEYRLPSGLLAVEVQPFDEKGNLLLASSVNPAQMHVLPTDAASIALRLVFDYGAGPQSVSWAEGTAPYQYDTRVVFIDGTPSNGEAKDCQTKLRNAAAANTFEPLAANITSISGEGADPTKQLVSFTQDAKRSVFLPFSGASNMFDGQHGGRLETTENGYYVAFVLMRSHLDGNWQKLIEFEFEKPAPSSSAVANADPVCLEVLSETANTSVPNDKGSLPAFDVKDATDKAILGGAPGYLKIAHWGGSKSEDQYELDGFESISEMETLVNGTSWQWPDIRKLLNEAPAKRNFVDRDPDRFYVHAIDLKATKTVLTAGIGTLLGDSGDSIINRQGQVKSSVVTPDASNILYEEFYDDITKVELLQRTGTHSFVSSSQILVPEDYEDYEKELIRDILRLAGGDAQKAQTLLGGMNISHSSSYYAELLLGEDYGSSVSLNPLLSQVRNSQTYALLSDDRYSIAKNDETGAGAILIADDQPNDRSHKATVDSVVAVLLPYDGTKPVTDRIPKATKLLGVCRGKGRDDRLELKLETYVLEEQPELADVAGGKVKRTGKFRELSDAVDKLAQDYVEADANAWGLKVEHKGAREFTPNLASIAPVVGAPSGVVSEDFIRAQVAGARMVWASACVRIKRENDALPCNGKGTCGQSWVLDTEPAINQVAVPKEDKLGIFADSGELAHGTKCPPMGKVGYAWNSSETEEQNVAEYTKLMVLKEKKTCAHRGILYLLESNLKGRGIPDPAKYSLEYPVAVVFTPPLATQRTVGGVVQLVRESKILSSPVKREIKFQNALIGDREVATITSLSLPAGRSLAHELGHLLTHQRDPERAKVDIKSITKAKPAVVTYSGGAPFFKDFDQILIDKVLGMPEVDGKTFTVRNMKTDSVTGARTFELEGLDSTAFGAYQSGGVVSSTVEVSKAEIIFPTDGAQVVTGRLWAARITEATARRARTCRGNDPAAVGSRLLVSRATDGTWSKLCGSQ